MAIESTISLPQIAVITFLSLVIIRYFFFSKSRPNAGPHSSRLRTGRNRTEAPINQAAMAQIMAVFPQLDRRAVAWDLQQTGSARGTIERIISRGEASLVEPPPSFQPIGLDPENPTRRAAQRRIKARKQADLITRFKLADRVGTEPSSGSSDGQSTATGAPGDIPSAPDARGSHSGSRTSKEENTWAPTKADRAAQLQRRKEEMVLQARKRLQEKIHEEQKGKEKSVVPIEVVEKEKEKDLGLGRSPVILDD